MPADFDVEQDFEYALFLPRELVPRFEVPRYVPRLMLAGADRLSVYSHPRCGAEKTTIRFADIAYIELERFLADCSLVLFTPRGILDLPFHGRDEEYVGVFLDHIQRRLFSISKRPYLLPPAGKSLHPVNWKLAVQSLSFSSHGVNICPSSQRRTSSTT